MNDEGMIFRVETWLLEDGRMRRPATRERVTVGDFIEQQQPGVDYAVYKRIKGTYSNSLGGISPWQKVRMTSLASAANRRNTRR